MENTFEAIVQHRINIAQAIGNSFVTKGDGIPVYPEAEFQKAVDEGAIEVFTVENVSEFSRKIQKAEHELNENPSLAVDIEKAKKDLAKLVKVKKQDSRGRMMTYYVRATASDADQKRFTSSGNSAQTKDGYTYLGKSNGKHAIAHKDGEVNRYTDDELKEVHGIDKDSAAKLKQKTDGEKLVGQGKFKDKGTLVHKKGDDHYVRSEDGEISKYNSNEMEEIFGYDGGKKEGKSEENDQQKKNRQLTEGVQQWIGEDNTHDDIHYLIIGLDESLQPHSTTDKEVKAAVQSARKAKTQSQQSEIVHQEVDRIKKKLDPGFTPNGMKDEQVKDILWGLIMHELTSEK